MPIRLLFPVIVGSLISACSLTLKPPPIPESVAELPNEFAGSEVAGSYEPLEWWESFADPVLDQVIEAVLASNFDLAGAVARVDQARARERIAKAPTFPLLQPSVGVNDFDTPYQCGYRRTIGRGWGWVPAQTVHLRNRAIPDRLGLTTYSIGAEFAYELDFWGRNRNDARAAGAERLASEADYLTARMGVLAETVRTYLEIVNLRHQQRLAGEIVEIFQHRKSLAESSYDRGLIDT